jgi:hypothetical protein
VTDSRQAGLRVLRATALAAVAVMLATGAHQLAGGDRPSAATLLQATVLVAVLMGLLVGRRRGVTALLLGLGGTQLLLHQWFSLATPGECAGHLATQYVPGVHLVPESMLPWGLLAQTARACATTGDAGATVIAAGLAGHALAAVVTGVLITRGEVLLACLVGLVVARLPRRSDQSARPHRAVAHRTPLLPTSPLLRHLHRRGPPALHAA